MEIKENNDHIELTKASAETEIQGIVNVIQYDNKYIVAKFTTNRCVKYFIGKVVLIDKKTED